MTRSSVHAARLAALALLGACAVGPPEAAPAPVPAVAARPEGAAQAASRAFLDSLIANRPRAASPRPPVESAAPVALDTAGGLAWLDVLRDPQLVALVTQAVAGNRDLALAQARVREYRAQVGVARSGLFPQLSANGGTSRNRVAQGPTAVEFDAVRVTGDVAWELDFRGRTRRGTQAARYDLGARQEDARAVVVELVGDVATAYLQVRELDESLGLAERTLASRRATLELARQRFRQGVTSELEARQFEAELADPAARMADFARQRAEAENRLGVLLGRGPGPVARGRPLEEVVRAVAIPDSLPGALVAARPDVRAAERALQASAARVGQTVAGRYPAVSLTGQYGTQRPDFDGLFGRSGEIYTAQLGVSVPVFTGGRQRGEESAARARTLQARARYEQTVLAALREADDALAGVRSGRDGLLARGAQVQALEAALNIAEQRYRAGVSSYLEVLDPQRQLFAARLALVQAQRQYLVAVVDLYRALGGGWEAPER